MSRRNRQAVMQPRRAEPVARASEPEPVRRFVPPPCAQCVSVRVELLRSGRIDQATADNPTSVYTTRERVRYCKCSVCGNTWKIAVS